MRAADYGQRGALGEYVRTSNAETLVIAHVESAQAVDHVDEIAAVDGVDVIFLGPTDLSPLAGRSRRAGASAGRQASRARRRGDAGGSKVLGVTVPTAEDAVAWLERGAR